MLETMATGPAGVQRVKNELWRHVEARIEDAFVQRFPDVASCAKQIVHGLVDGGYVAERLLCERPDKVTISM
jgi:hypothetical protein